MDREEDKGKKQSKGKKVKGKRQKANESSFQALLNHPLCAKKSKIRPVLATSI